MKDRLCAARKCYGTPLLFDPRDGQTVVRAPGQGEGYWAGAPSVVYDADRARFYLYYRLRKPRPVRGGACFIADSEDGLYFRTIWSSTKDDFASPSVERFSLIRALDGKWLLYASYVDPADNRWRIDLMEADSPSGFQVRYRRKVLTAGDVGVEGVKDPWVMIVDGLYMMFLSFAANVPVDASAREAMHATGDIYNTGLTRSTTALAVSGDGRHYEWVGEVFAPRPGSWDGYASRLGCLLPTTHGWLGYYDGSASVAENYEERTGLVQSPDLSHFYRLSATGPSLVSPHGSGSLRYIDAIQMEEEVWLYYEYARPDGSHELRMSRVRR